MELTNTRGGQAGSVQAQRLTGSHLGRSELGLARCHAGSSEPSVLGLHCTEDAPHPPNSCKAGEEALGVVHRPNLPCLPVQS